MTLRQHEPSAHAPCTRMIVEFGGNPFVLEDCEFAAACAVFCACASLARELSRATPRDAAVSVPRNLRRSIFLSSSSSLVAITFREEMNQRYWSLSRSFRIQAVDAICR